MKFIIAVFIFISTNLYATLLVDEVKVYKSLHKMDLLYHGQIIKSYRVMLGRGGSGPKRHEGDLLVPEGKYILDEKNPDSLFHKSIHISYPDANDIARAHSDGVDPGGSVFIHGLPNSKSEFIEWLREKAIKIKDRIHLEKIIHKLDWTRGCIAVSDTEIEEIYNSLPLPAPITIYH